MLNKFYCRLISFFTGLLGVGLCCLILQIIALHFFGGGSVTLLKTYFTSPNVTRELVELIKVAPYLQKHLLLIDETALKNKNCLFCQVHRYDPITFAILANGNSSKETVIPLLKAWEIGYWVERFVLSKSANKPLGFVLQHVKTAVTFEILLLYEKEDHWWHGSLSDDINYVMKLNNLKLNRPLALTYEESFSKSLFIQMPGSYLKIPSDVGRFNSNRGRFILCDFQRADQFHRLYGRDASPRANRFRHRVRKLLGLTQTVADKFRLPFWLSSGTCLGWYRQCDVIPYSIDVDIGIFSANLSKSEQISALISAFEDRQFKLMHRFGKDKENLQLSFAFRDVKLDIFFFYERDHSFWNFAHQMVYQDGKLHHGVRFKYRFDKFTLCWTEFLQLRVRVPCDTKRYIEANYGPDWFKPVPEWHWDTSPFNGIKDGEWSPQEVSDVLLSF